MQAYHCKKPIKVTFKGYLIYGPYGLEENIPLVEYSLDKRPGKLAQGWALWLALRGFEIRP